jgi:hypothetical protein
MRNKASLVCILAVGIAGTVAADTDIPVRDWSVPTGSSIHTLAGDYTNPLPFIALAPCRIVDTRGNGAPIQGGIFGPGESRNYTLTGQCSIPAGAKAVSLNFTVVNATGGGMLVTYPAGGTKPTVSTLNYVAGQTVANAAIVPLSTAGAITVITGVHGAHVLIDTNGYFSDTPAVGTNAFAIKVNNGGYAIFAENFSSTCPGVCGIAGIVDSATAGAIAIEGLASGSVARNYGVYGRANGTGDVVHPISSNQLSAGIWGKATNTTADVAGVLGEISSSGSHAAGVLGMATSVSAQPGWFYNTNGGVNPTSVYLGYSGSALWSTAGILVGSITGTSLSISGLPKNFVSPHPLDPTKEIVYAAMEGPSADVFFRGTAHLVNGSALIPVPEHFRLTAREDSYMTTLTCVGEHAKLWVASEGPDGIVVGGSGDAAFHYVVYAERDETRDQQAVRENVHFTPQALRGKGGSLPNLPERTKAILVKNGILNPDLTINTRTAERAGWTIPPDEVAPTAR